MSAIQWTEATWNPIVGCSICDVSCRECYAMPIADELSRDRKTPHYAGTTETVKGRPIWTGKIALAPEHIINKPIGWTKSRMVFVNSMGDLFHENAPDEWIDMAFAVMARCPQHIFQILTKRAERMCKYMTAPRRVELPNVWLGISAGRQKEFDERIAHLRMTPAALRFVSVEPLIAPVDVGNLARIGWIIIGGESGGADARPLDLAWMRAIVARCKALSVPCFVKQLGSAQHLRHNKGGDPSEWPADLRIRQWPRASEYEPLLF